MLSELSRMIRTRCQLIFDQSYVVRTVNLITQKNCVKIRLLTYTHLIFFYFTFKLTISCVPNDVNECNNFLSKFFLLRLLVVFLLVAVVFVCRFEFVFFTHSCAYSLWLDCQSTLLRLFNENISCQLIVRLFTNVYIYVYSIM